ncbi:MAG: hypothetical protein HY916_07265 [Desulfovibrio sp.]|jgi:hypothetical protein|nr:hypothetical protein [Desulfovibrio sp.]
MRAKALSACLFLLLLSGCLPKNKDWTHPQVANPRKEDQLFQEDSAFCEGKAGPELQGQERQKALDACLARLGWQRKE